MSLTFFHWENRWQREITCHENPCEARHMRCMIEAFSSKKLTCQISSKMYQPTGKKPWKMNGEKSSFGWKHDYLAGCTVVGKVAKNHKLYLQFLSQSIWKVDFWSFGLWISWTFPGSLTSVQSREGIKMILLISPGGRRSSAGSLHPHLLNAHRPSGGLECVCWLAKMQYLW